MNRGTEKTSRVYRAEANSKQLSGGITVVEASSSHASWNLQPTSMAFWIRKLTYERIHALSAPPAPSGKFDRVFRALFFAMLVERQLNQAVDQLRIGNPRRLPHLRVHADRREAGDGIDFVQEDAPARLAPERNPPAPFRGIPGSGTRARRTPGISAPALWKAWPGISRRVPSSRYFAV